MSGRSKGFDEEIWICCQQVIINPGLFGVLKISQRWDFSNA